MRNQFLSSIGAVGMALVSISLAALPMAGQAAKSALPRTPDGHPDLQGTYDLATMTPFERLAPVERHAHLPGAGEHARIFDRGFVRDYVRAGARVALHHVQLVAMKISGAIEPSLIVHVGHIDYQRVTLPAPDGLPHPRVGRSGSGSFQILQSASALTFVYEYAGAVRNIFLNNPGPAPADSWMGQSVGRWEGDTLVIDVTDLNDQTWFDRAGNFHSDKLHVVERYTRTSPDVISYEATIEDPTVFTRPWKISMPLYRRQEKNAQLLDFKCVEFVEELLYGQYRKRPLNQ